MPEFPTANRKVNVLSLAGGGFMGLFTAELLAGLEEKDTSVFATTDLFAGTSIGALLALGLAARIPATTIAAKMREQGRSIFPKLKTFPVGGEFWQTLYQRGKSSAYDVKPLRTVLTDLLGDKRMGELERRVLIPTVDLTSGTFRAFRGGEDNIDADKTLVDVALASAAAPTYFPAHRIGDELFADGGLAANAPDALAVLEALQRLGAGAHHTRLLAIGTTWSKAAMVAPEKTANWGLSDWSSKLVEVSMTGQITMARQFAEALLGAERICVIDPPRSKDQDRVVRLDRADSNAMAALTSLAKEALRDIEQNEGKDRFFKIWRGHQAGSM